MQKLTKYAFVLILLSAFPLSSFGKKPFTFEDVMRFKSLRTPVISNDAKWAAYSTIPDRGDWEAVIKSIKLDSASAAAKDSIVNDEKYIIKYGADPKFSQNSQWLFATLKPKAIDVENNDKSKLNNGLAIMRLSDANLTKIENVKYYDISNDSKWLAYSMYEDDHNKTDNKKYPKREVGITMVLRHLETGAELNFEDVTEFTFDSLSNYIAFAVADKDAKKNALYYIDLKSNLTAPMLIQNDSKFHYSSLKWNTQKPWLAYIAGKERFDGAPDSCSLSLWNISIKSHLKLIASKDAPKDWFIPYKNNLRWTTDGDRLFFGFRPLSDTEQYIEKITYVDSNFYDINTIRTQTTLDMWHWNDPLIKTMQKHWWDNGGKDELYLAVYSFNESKYIQLADKNIPQAYFTNNPKYTIGLTQVPYMKDIAYDGDYSDLYKIDIRTGQKVLVDQKLQEGASLSPLGKYIAYFKNKNWYLHSNDVDTTVLLNQEGKIQYYDVDNDTPKDPASYGIAGWTKNDAAVLIYDKYDIWTFFTGVNGNTSILNQTDADGRLNNTTFRIVDLKKNREYFEPNEYVYLSGFNRTTKTRGIYTLELDLMGPIRVYNTNKNYRLIAKSQDTNRIIYSKESYDEFPDLWVADTAFKYTKKITDVNPQMKEFTWGTTQLVKWTSATGDSLEGYIVKPEGFDSKKRYPVVIYFYEIMSDRANFFEQPGNHHRPCFPVYNSDGYVIFLPDVKFKIGSPGQSALNCILPGVRKLVDMGIADSTAIGLWGHSWSGYQAAYMLTQTDKFACAVAGAPVGNMTSAYSGIRLESGMTRQFQYEKEQSRIGGNLWDSLDAYIRNSPIFYAPKMNTPLLIEFGDKDNAVPWSQGIELYMALRRLSKPVIMLEYRDEPHHPKKYYNKMDYAVRMKEFYDHYLKKQPAADWIINGIEYHGK